MTILNRAMRTAGASLAFAVSALAPLPSLAQTSSQLVVQVDGIRNQQGQLCLSVFSSQQGFPNRTDVALRNQCIAVTTSQPSVTFDALPAGSYAVAVLHDSNSDNTINRNFLGIPQEGFGFSGNPVIRTGPPSFGESVVVVAGRRTDLQIRLNYF